MIVSFSSLNLDPSVLHTITRRNCHRPAPVRRRTVPTILRNHSLVTDTRANANGATNFALPLLRRLVAHRPRTGKHHPMHTLVLAPAHRLTTRVNRGIHSCDGCLGVHSLIIFNNIDVGPRVVGLHNNISILITAPKHLLSLRRRGTIGLSRIRVLILSRTSHVLSVNFVRSVHHILAGLPTGHRGLLFSTAFSSSVGTLTRGLLRGPLRVRITHHGATSSRIARRIRFISGGHGHRLLSRVVNGKG